METRTHIPVLAAEIEATLAPRPGETLIDATAGLGGHSALLAGRLAGGPAGGADGGVGRGRVILNDLDGGNLSAAVARVEAAAGVEAGGMGVEVVGMRGNFADLSWRMGEAGLSGDMVLADLGFSSNQMDDGARGFSFMREGPLDMRLDPTGPVTAAELVNTLPEGELVRVLREFGEEPGAGRVARKIAQARRESPITTTGRLAEVVRSALGPKHGSRIDPSTKTFQALRIAVNDELGALDALLAAVKRSAKGLAGGGAGGGAEAGGGWLRAGARVGIISFHSLEDRRVKQGFAELVRLGWAEEVTRGPVEAGPEEVSGNPRSRSAKLRVVRLSDVTARPRSLS